MTERAERLLTVPPKAEISIIPLSSILRGSRRLEAENYLSEGYSLRSRIERIGSVPLGQLARVWQPDRLKGIQVSQKHGQPFLAATQVFDIRPRPRKWLALDHTPNAASRFVERGWILVTCSGSVGDAIMSYRPLDEIVISHDLLRVVAMQDENCGYLYAYLRTNFARRMMRSTKYGNVIKHLEVEHLQDVPVITVGSTVRDMLNAAVSRCFALRNEAHDLLLDSEMQYADKIGAVNPTAVESGFPARGRDLFHGSRRLDAYSYNPLAAAILSAVERAGLKTQTLESVTDRIWMPLRLSRTPKDGETAYFSANELFSVNPPVKKRVDLKNSPHVSGFFVKAGWIVMARSGQIYGLNGSVVLTTKAHEAPFFSDDLIRIIPDVSKIRPGYLFTVLGHPDLGRPLVLRASYGTSIPHIEPSDVCGIPVVRLTRENEDAIADKSERAVALRAIADDLENAATVYMEAIIANAIGDGSEDDIDGALADLRIVEAEADPDSTLRGPALEESMKQWLS
ncbi:MAG: hypothetical protein IT350_00395 [Deltaproteobacteria bacterium]|nr:hypothetical protein [Deltaproteobacteria bacterium]